MICFTLLSGLFVIASVYLRTIIAIVQWSLPTNESRVTPTSIPDESTTPVTHTPSTVIIAPIEVAPIEPVEVLPIKDVFVQPVELATVQPTKVVTLATLPSTAAVTSQPTVTSEPAVTPSQAPPNDGKFMSDMVSEECGLTRLRALCGLELSCN